ncbi:hypothetical protein F4558_002851 [Micromonospora profundi]|nr:hypothetical protein [Micromonospora profundi]
MARVMWNPSEEERLLHSETGPLGRGMARNGERVAAEQRRTAPSPQAALTAANPGTCASAGLGVLHWGTAPLRCPKGSQHPAELRPLHTVHHGVRSKRHLAGYEPEPRRRAQLDRHTQHVAALRKLHTDTLSAPGNVKYRISSALLISGKSRSRASSSAENTS